MHRQVVARQKLHHTAQTCQGAEGLRDLHGFLGGDALNRMHPLRFVFDHPQGILTETLHQTRGRGRADPLDDAGGQIGGNLVLALGHAALHRLGGELRAVAGMIHPRAGDGHALACGSAGDAAHDSDRLALIRYKAEHRIAVFFILKDDVLYGTLHRAAFAHSFRFLYCK